MKKIFLAIFLAVALVSCDINTIQQTTDSIKQADSLLTKANDGIKTLDSISKTINDSDGIAKKVIIPEIEKQKKSIDSTIKSGSWQIDSINKEIEKITKNVKVGTEVVKTLDSANRSLEKGGNVISVLTKTADKILQQTKSQPKVAENPAPNPPSQNQNNSVTAVPKKVNPPLVKTAKLEIQVENLDEAKALLKQKIRENNADLVSENFTQNEGIMREYTTVKVPLQYFDSLVSDVSSQLGDVKSKSTETEGNDRIASQMCDVEITLVQNENISGTAFAKEKVEEDPNSLSGAFMKGFNVLGDAMLFLLPFWPIILIAVGLWYFIAKRNNKKREEEFQRQLALEREKIKAAEALKPSAETPQNTEPTNAEENKNGDDISKYMPKE
ncbi:hypothetical protein AP75_10570 [Kaistella haifensis DSM 19056]|uniref:DUF4349 domain-containing protein n=1 Tax=Kaistella haifensis DSM 19056 TaxID=1450526 RepID=A0A246B853_9FLAO|nr:DUF4349 domain-containing protein [Kaistella haifensis]OWK97565.1 hypothetical protein AP75_10570 [Kaistella haifensis DSM 19056]